MGAIGLIVNFTFVVINTSGIYVKICSPFCTYDKRRKSNYWDINLAPNRVILHASIHLAIPN